MTTISLNGLKTQPLLHYMAAHGLIRALGQQRREWCPRIWWDGTLQLQLHDAGLDDLVTFFSSEFSPSPIMSPWNGSARLTNSKPEYQLNLDLIRQSPLDRYQRFARAVKVLQKAWEEAEKRGLIASDGKVKTGGTHKQRFIQLVRNRAPDDVVEWVDASITLLDNSLAYPLIVGGTGGNVGNGDLSVNYVSTATALLPPDPTTKPKRGFDSQGMLVDALTGTNDSQLTAKTSHHFDLGSISGPDLSNPWLFLLAMEGALAFASSVSRRFGADKRGAGAHAALPYTVYLTPNGFASASNDEQAKGEFWAPIWTKPKTPAAVQAMVSEGRIQWGSSQAQTGLDVVRALANRGVDQSIGSFARYVFAVRNGQNVVAVPAGVYRVETNEHVNLLGPIDNWIRFVPTSKASHDLLTARRAVLTSQFNFATRQTPDDLADVLAGLFDVEHALARSPKSAQSVRRPMAGLNARDWVNAMSELYQAHPEFRLALSWASQRDHWASAVADGDHPKAAGNLRTMLRPVTSTGRNRLEFTVNLTTPVPGLGYRPVHMVLADALVFRTRFVAGRTVRPVSGGEPNSPGHSAIDQGDTTTVSNPSHIDASTPDLPGIASAFDYGQPVPLGDIAAYLPNKLDERRLERYLKALLMLESWDDVAGGDLRHNIKPAPYPAEGYDPLWGLMAPFFSRHTLRPANTQLGQSPNRRIDTAERTMPPLRARAHWPPLLVSGHHQRLTAELLTAYRAAGFPSPISATRIGPSPTLRVAAALLASPSGYDLGGVRRAISPQPDDWDRQACGYSPSRSGGPTSPEAASVIAAAPT